MKNNKVFITGISGFTGSHMARRLLGQGSRVSGLYRRRADGLMPHNLTYFGIDKDVTLLEGDLRDISSVESALEISKPDVIFHFAAQSFVQRSFINPAETMDINCTGTSNLLEAVRTSGLDPVVVFAGSSEEYGLVIFAKDQYKKIVEKHGTVFPPPQHIPELPVREENPLRPLSPYAVSKVYGDHLTRNYHISYGMRTVVSRGFNHEGAGRGIMYVTSSIAHQVVQLKHRDSDRIVVGNVNAFRDWSHIDDIINGYCLLYKKGRHGDVYNQGSQRANSVLTYLLLSLECAGYRVQRLRTIEGNRTIEDPVAADKMPMFGLSFEKTRVDRLLLEGKASFDITDRGIIVETDKGDVRVDFDPDLFRPSDVPIMLTSTEKIGALGFKTNHSLRDIIADQLAYHENLLL